MGTINEWTTAIYCVLKEAFGETCTVGDETMQMEPPCLAVLLSQASQKPGPNGCGQRAVVFEVRGRFTSAAQMREAADTLFSVLGLLPLPDSTYLRGCGMRCEAAYGLLHFFVRYEGVVSAVREIPVMEDLKRVQTSD